MATEKISISEKSTINNKEVAAAYVRVSTTKQKEGGYSIENQIESAKKYAKEKGWLLPDRLIFTEDKSASTIDGKEINKNNLTASFKHRPELQKLLNNAQNKNFNHLIIHARDRLSRSLEESIILDVFLKNHNIDINYTKTSENLNNEDEKITRLLDVILSSISELEANILSTRVKEGNRLCIEKGWWAGGNAPFGYFRKNKCDELTKKTNSFLVKSDFQSKLILKIYNYYLNGLGYKSIAKKMNKEYGFIKWTKSKIETIIKNQTYTGQIAWNRRGGRRNHKKHDNIILSPFNENNEIISKDIWNNTVQFREERNKSKDAFLYNTPFIFKNKLICAKCNRLMKPKNPGKHKSNVYRCATNKIEREICNCIVPSKIIYEEFRNHIQSLFKIKDYSAFFTEYNKMFDAKIDELTDFINVIDKKILGCENNLMKIKSTLLEESNYEIKEALKKRKIILSKLLLQYKSTKSLALQKVNTPKINEENFTKLLEKFMPYFFNTTLDTTIVDTDKIQMYRRSFVNTFIDKIIIDYNSKTKKIESMEIIFIPPEFI